MATVPYNLQHHGHSHFIDDFLVQNDSAIQSLSYDRTVQELPGLERLVGMNGIADVDNAIYSTSSIVRKSNFVRGMMLETWDEIIDLLGQDRDHALTQGIRCLLVDCYKIDVCNRSEPLFARTLCVFICLAEISRLCRSRKIGLILYRFFRKYGQEIMSEDRGTVLSWGVAISHACMTEEEQIMCNRDVLRYLEHGDNSHSRNPIRYPEPEVHEYLRLLGISGRYQGFHPRLHPNVYSNCGRRPDLKRYYSAPQYSHLLEQRRSRALVGLDDLALVRPSRDMRHDVGSRLRNIDEHVGDLSEDMRELKDMLRRGDMSSMPGGFGIGF